MDRPFYSECARDGYVPIVVGYRVGFAPGFMTTSWHRSKNEAWAEAERMGMRLPNVYRIISDVMYVRDDSAAYFKDKYGATD